MSVPAEDSRSGPAADVIDAFEHAMSEAGLRSTGPYGGSASSSDGEEAAGALCVVAAAMALMMRDRRRIVVAEPALT